MARENAERDDKHLKQRRELNAANVTQQQQLQQIKGQLGQLQQRHKTLQKDLEKSEKKTETLT